MTGDINYMVTQEMAFMLVLGCLIGWIAKVGIDSICRMED